MCDYLEEEESHACVASYSAQLLLESVLSLDRIRAYSLDAEPSRPCS